MTAEQKNQRAIKSSRPHGGKRPGSGRKPGTKARATVIQKATLSELARKHTTAALRTLVDVAATGTSEAARIAAASAILDRGYGKPPAAIEHSGPDGGPIEYTDPFDLSEEDLAVIAAQGIVTKGNGRRRNGGGE